MRPLVDTKICKKCGEEKAITGVCAICGKPETHGNGKSSIKLLAVDHCHTTGKIRGLLCHKCNLGIGHLDDSIDRLEAAINYLEKHYVNEVS